MPTNPNNQINLSINRSRAVDSQTKTRNEAGPSSGRSRTVGQSSRRPPPLKRARRNKLDTVENNMKSNPKCRKNQQDFNEFEVFGKHVGIQLKSMLEEDAVTAQEKIQSILTYYRLKKIRGKNQLAPMSPTTPEPLARPSCVPFSSYSSSE